jgi:hypothetical protein
MACLLPRDVLVYFTSLIVRRAQCNVFARDDVDEHDVVVDDVQRRRHVADASPRRDGPLLHVASSVDYDLRAVVSTLVLVLGDPLAAPELTP